MSMTRKQAQAEAVRRWGENAFAKPHRLIGYTDTGMLKMVGVITHPQWHSWRKVEELYGAGETWEIAFEEATKRGH